jgi:hypothetical protein
MHSRVDDDVSQPVGPHTRVDANTEAAAPYALHSASGHAVLYRCHSPPPHPRTIALELYAPTAAAAVAHAE